MSVLSIVFSVEAEAIGWLVWLNWTWEVVVFFVSEPSSRWGRGLTLLGKFVWEFLHSYYGYGYEAHERI